MFNVELAVPWRKPRAQMQTTLIRSMLRVYSCFAKPQKDKKKLGKPQMYGSGETGVFLLRFAGAKAGCAESECQSLSRNASITVSQLNEPIKFLLTVQSCHASQAAWLLHQAPMHLVALRVHSILPGLHCPSIQFAAKRRNCLLYILLAGV